MAVFSIPFTVSGNYVYDSNRILVSGGLAKLKEDTTNLYGRWTFNETSGLVLNDNSANNIDGTLINFVGNEWTAGKLNNCLYFNGLDQSVSLGNLFGNFERTDAFSISIWIRTTSANNMCFIGKTNNERGWSLRIDGGNCKFQLINTKNTNLISTRCVHRVDDDIWHHVVVTYDGSITAAGVSYYVDNVNHVLTIEKDSLTDTIVSPHDFTFGSTNNTIDFLEGYIDQCCVFNKVLNTTEISYLWNSGSGRETNFYTGGTSTIYDNIIKTHAYITSWSGFSVAKGVLEGSLGYQLSTNKSDWYYWNGASWVTPAGSSYNSESVVNSNIGSFPLDQQDIYVKSFMISDGSQRVEIDEIQITYSENELPTVDAGSNMVCKDHETINPFYDADFYDADGTVVKAYYKVDGEVDIWTEILQGGYATLLEAVQNFTYTFDNIGNKTVRLRAEDDLGDTNEDFLLVTVNFWYVTINVTDRYGIHLTNFLFSCGDGHGWITESSPFTHGYNYSPSNYIATVDKDGYATAYFEISYDDGTVTFIMNPIQTSTRENLYIDQVVYSNDVLISGRIRIYSEAASVGTDDDVIETFQVTATESNGVMIDYKEVKQD